MAAQNTKKLEKILKKYANRCPKCNAYHPGIWRVCTSCQTPLINSRLAAFLGFLSKIAKFVAVIGVILLLANYVRFFQSTAYGKFKDHLLEGNFHAVAQDISSAFIDGVYKPVSNSFKKGPPIEASSPTKHLKKTPVRSVTEFTPTGKITRFEYDEDTSQSPTTRNESSKNKEPSKDPDALWSGFQTLIRWVIGLVILGLGIWGVVTLFKNVPTTSEELAARTREYPDRVERATQPTFYSQKPASKAHSDFVLLGWLAFITGFAVMVFFWLFFDTSVEVPTFDILGSEFGGGRVNNIGLLQDRQNGIFIGGFICLMGFVCLLMNRKKDQA